MKRSRDLPRPPRLARLILLAFTPARVRAQVAGDLLEGYQAKRRDRGGVRAYFWLWRQLLSLDVLRLSWSSPNRTRKPVQRPSQPVASVLKDARYGLRALRKQPVFAAAVLGTLALGIGATTAIFTVVNAILLRPLPYHDADELVMIFRTVPRFGFTRSTSSFPDYNDWRRQSTSFTSMAAYGYTTATYVDANSAVQWQGHRVSANLFSLLGENPAAGRPLTPSDDLPSANRVVILSHVVWQEQFGEDSSLIGRSIVLDGESAMVVGVMPEDFSFPSSSTQFWTPLRGNAETMERDSNFLTVIARLRTGVSLSVAQSEMTRLAGQIDDAMPDGNRGYGVFLERRHAFVVRNARTALLVFMGAVALVLVVAVTNVANLMLAKGATRVREVAVRTALGAGRGRIVRQMLTESTVLATLGGALGLLTAVVLLRLIIAAGPTLPRIGEVRLDTMALTFISCISVLSGIAFGTVPAFVAARADPQRSLKTATETLGVGRFGRRFQQTLVVVEIAVAMTLTVGAGLLLNSFARLTTVDPGFRPANIVAARVAAPRAMMDMSIDRDTRMRVMDTQRIFYETVLAKAAAQPGAVTAGLAYGLPLGRYTFGRVVRPEGMTYEPGNAPVVSGNIISGDYFEALGIPLVRGRGFTLDDRFDSPSVIVINQAMADAFWPNDDPLAKRIKIGDGDRPWTTVVGVVPNTVLRSLSEEPEPMYYRPFVQAQWPEAMYVVLRSNNRAESVIRGLREEIHALNPTVPLTDVTTASQLIAESVAAPRFRMLVLFVFGVAAASLALVGIYGVLTFVVEDRTREIGIRLALGANRARVLRMVLTGGARLAVLGVTIGLVAAAGLTRFLAGMLHDITPYDPITYATCAVILVTLSLFACYLPARTAATRDPLESLRFE